MLAKVADTASSSKGILLALISTGLFVLVGAVVRILNEELDLFQILFSRQLIFIIVLLPAICRSYSQLIKPRQVSLHLLRVTGAFIALYFGFLTVSNMPLADATALGFTQVLFVALICKLFLSEDVNRIRLLTILVGFVGVMLVVQPGFESHSLFYILTGLFAAFGAALAVVCVRKLSTTESKTAILAYQAVFVGVVSLIPSVFVWKWPDTTQLALLIVVGLLSSVAQWVGVTAYKVAEANLVANVEYAKILYSVALGYFLFHEIPNSLAFIGMSLLIGSALIPLIHTRTSRKKFPRSL